MINSGRNEMLRLFSSHVHFLSFCETFLIFQIGGFWNLGILDGI
jgi:hypothetical protein